MTTEEVATKIEKRRIVVISNATDLLPDYYPKNVYGVKKVKQYLPRDKALGRLKALVQFFDARSGGLRTVAASDIIKIK